MAGGGRRGTPGDRAGHDAKGKEVGAKDAGEGEIMAYKMHHPKYDIHHLKHKIRHLKYDIHHLKHLLKVARFKSATRHEQGNSPVGQCELPTLASNACIRETVRF